MDPFSSSCKYCRMRRTDPDVCLSSSSAAFCSRLHQIKAMIKPIKSKPPRTPPTMGAVIDFFTAVAGGPGESESPAVVEDVREDAVEDLEIAVEIAVEGAVDVKIAEEEVAEEVCVRIRLESVLSTREQIRPSKIHQGNARIDNIVE